MNVLTPGKPFLGRKQVTQIAEKRPRTLEAFMTMSLHGLSSNTRIAHGPAIMETLRQVRCALRACCSWYGRTIEQVWYTRGRCKCKWIPV